MDGVLGSISLIFFYFARIVVPKVLHNFRERWSARLEVHASSCSAAQGYQKSTVRAFYACRGFKQKKIRSGPHDERGTKELFCAKGPANHAPTDHCVVWVSLWRAGIGVVRRQLVGRDGLRAVSTHRARTHDPPLHGGKRVREQQAAIVCRWLSAVAILCTYFNCFEGVETLGVCVDRLLRRLEARQT